MSLPLSKDEQLVNEETFTTNLLLFWLKTNFALTTKRVMGNAPNTLMGIIPLGKNEITYPLKNIAGVASSTKFHFLRLIIGIFLVPISLSILTSSFLLAIVLLLLGALALLNCYTSTLVITNNAGQAPVVEVSILDKGKVQSFVNVINSKIADL